MNKKLYVGSLPYSITEDELRDLFSPFGAIASARVITDKFTGRSKGFGFVEMATEEDAQKAIDGNNGKEIEGRALVVSEAKAEKPREGGGGGGYGGGGGGGYGDRGNRGGPSGDRGPPRGRGGYGGGGGGGGNRGGGGGGGRDDDNFGNR